MCGVHDQKSATLPTCHVARLVGVKTLVDIEQSLSPDLSPIQGKSLCNGRICPLEAKKELIKLNFFDPQWKTIIHFHYPKNEIFSPAVFNILKEPFIVQKETLHQQKGLDLSYLDLEGQGRGIVRRAPHPNFIKSKFRFFQ